MLARFRSWFRSLWLRGQVEEDLAREIEEHIAMRAADWRDRGLSAEEAERRARLEFGSTEAWKEECREALGLRLVDGSVRNVRFAVRQLRRAPVFALTAVGTLALCIAANTIVFSLVDPILLRPLSLPRPDRLAQVVLRVHGSQGEWLQEAQNGATFGRLREGSFGMDVAAEGMASGVNLAAEGHVEQVWQHRVSAGYFSVLGVPPLLGREFQPEEDVPGGPAVVILEHSLWQRTFDGDPGVLGSSVMLRGEPYAVVGVMPPDFDPPTPADVWTPLRPDRTGEGSGTNYVVIARLQEGAGWPEAEAGLASIRPEEIDLRAPEGGTMHLGLLPLQEAATLGVRRVLFLLWAAVGAVLLLGCVNLAGLLLARGTRRTREIATRMALGGGRGSVVRQLLTESLVLAAAGGGVGLVLGYAGLEVLRPHLRAGLGTDAAQLDARVLAVSMGLSLLTSVVFGLFPAWHTTRMDIRGALVEAGGQGIVGARVHWPRRILLVLEIALGVLLLVGATQFTRTFVHLAGLPPGFDGRGLYTASLSLQDTRYREADRVSALFEETRSRIRALPGVSDAAVGLSLPYERALNMPLRIEDGPNAGSSEAVTNLTYVTPGYFETLRIPLLRGRALEDSDAAGTPLAAVVNRAFLRRFLPEGEAIGTHVRFGGAGTFEIVGVAGDVLHSAGWGGFGPIEAIPGAYIPVAQTTDGMVQLVHTWFQPRFVVRTRGRHEALAAEMQRALAAADPGLPFSGFATMEQVRGRALARQRFHALVVDSFAALAVVLTAIGIGGLIAGTVAERWREIGLRLALGSTLARAIGSLAAPAMIVALAGLAVGSALAYPVLAAIRSFVWGIRPADPVNFAVTALLVLLVTAGSALAPALRLRRMDLAATLRRD